MKTENQTVQSKNSVKDAKNLKKVEEELSASDASLDAVRDILFGAQIRQTDKQRADLEKQLKDLISNLKKESDQRFDSLQKNMDSMRHEVDAAADKNAQSFANQLEKMSGDFNNSIQGLEKATSDSDADITAQLNENVSAINSQMEKWKVDILSELDTAHSQLMNDKTDRETLSALFSNMSEQLLEGKKSK